MFRIVTIGRVLTCLFLGIVLAISVGCGDSIYRDERRVNLFFGFIGPVGFSADVGFVKDGYLAAVFHGMADDMDTCIDVSEMFARAGEDWSCRPLND